MIKVNESPAFYYNLYAGAPAPSTLVLIYALYISIILAKSHTCEEGGAQLRISFWHFWHFI